MNGKNESGFTYIWLMIFIAVMCVNIAIVAPVWRTTVKRDKEEELRYRLESIRSGIKTYKSKYNKFPDNISELVALKCLRRLFPDPMTAKLDWTLNGNLGFSDIHSNSKEESMKSTKELKDYYSAW
ncbi:MAG: type II secretion system protein [bacterium]|nr:type II secretion system protein [bacterium]